jgi:hypothetical protein
VSATNKAMKNIEHPPLAGMVSDLGSAIAEAQWRMDQTALKIAHIMGSTESGVEIGGKKYSLIELGFTPSFYHLTEATIEAKVSFTAAESSSFSFGAQIGVFVGYFAASVNASYSQKYSYEVSGSSSITARFVSVPPPTLLQDVIRAARENKIENKNDSV